VRLFHDEKYIRRNKMVFDDASDDDRTARNPNTGEQHNMTTTNDVANMDVEMDEIMRAEMQGGNAAAMRRADESRPSGTGGDGEGPQGRMFSNVEAAGDEVVDRVGKLRRITQIPISFVLERLQLKLDSSDLMIDLLIYIPFLIMFVFFFTNGRDTESNFYVAQGIRNQYGLTEFPKTSDQLGDFRNQMSQNQRLWVELDKNYWGMGNQGDWNPWLSDVFVRSTFECDTRDPGAALPAGSIRAAKGQTFLIGAARARTIRVRADSCALDPYIMPENRSLFPSSCYALGHSDGDEDKGPFCTDQVDSNGDPLFRYYSSSEVPGVPTVGWEGVYHSGGYIFQIPFDLSCDTALELVNNATGNDDCGFCDQWGSRFVNVEWFAYTPHSDAFHVIKYFQEVDGAGWWRLLYTLRSFQVWTPSYVNRTIFEMFFLAFVLYYWGVLIYQSIAAFRESRLLLFWVEMWNILELANLICFLVVFGVRFAWMAKSNSSNIQFPMAPHYPDNLDVLQSLDNTQVVANSVNTLLTFLKALKYVRLNAQLGVLTRTLAVCQQSIAGVLVLFFLIVTSYAVAGWALWGVNMEEYSTLGFSMSASMRLLVGDSDYEFMRQQNRFLATAYFWSFLILGLFLLLNFIIAILSDSFAKISGRAFTQTMEELLLRYYQNMKAFLRPDNLKRIFKGIVSGNSEPKLIRSLMRQLEERMKIEEDILNRERAERRRVANEADEASKRYDYDPAIDDDEDILVHMKHEEFEAWIDPTTYQLLSSHFFDYTWDEMMNDYDDAKKSSEEVDKRMMFDKVEAGVKRVVGEDLVKVDQLDEVLTTLEAQVREMIDNVSKK
jgi:hypothetical protein